MKSTIFLVVIGCAALSIPTDNPQEQIKQVYTESSPKFDLYKQGDTLPPDMGCTDTLIVTDAKGLNNAMLYYDNNLSGTWNDRQMDSCFHIYCTVK